MRRRRAERAAEYGDGGGSWDLGARWRPPRNFPRGVRAAPRGRLPAGARLIWKAYYNNGQLPSSDNSKGSFWWRDCIALQENFKQLTSCTVGSGNSTLLWHDTWKDTPLKHMLPHLYSFAKNKRITVQKAREMYNNDIYDLFNLPLSGIAVDECNLLQQMFLQLDQTTSLVNDTWKFPGNHINYPTKKVYLSLVDSPIAPPPYKWIWKSASLPKQKFFFWLLIQDRLNTKELMARKNFYVESKFCVLCDDNMEESMIHLFFGCDFSRNFWWKLGEEWNIDLDTVNMMLEAKERSSNIFFKEALISGCWCIWNHRNKIIFDGEQRHMDTCFAFFKAIVGLVRHRIKPSLKDGMQEWIDSL